ncbi:bifunctional methylenetetrahydrofolate dehydrogenase/methenyltetrahydrofolate cyclohydrolase FolD [Melissococcus plutonius]|uniref:Bifunctional protein FolD n=2 Tax=Melissococcus plutonius TaxID=33970 RepID=F3Y9P4_MELPT|nr:bifunctional methylenetetrahydrofolate dehydrogenase/methenyltetrahydrofolate cyclohydrolase FolD [Melissococcus plutonius]BAL62397.1 methylenetetrahydrofolate dehydrogenase (NADP+)/ methenyltetrahydrofolate cyclohydrolase [Melissococcus plutonius DAT561]AIM24760.1 bifunctional protein FolD [Melissococcus plutonius S1]KMT24871.1 bifunctional protein FolD [Melissococcus plutonius]KMT29530.1 bifunctional protein FolD [Melissococcus plutonius]KMT31573.1 bifunctional protein FolD [Melissococcus
MGIRMDGKKLAKELQLELTTEVSEIKKQGIQPGIVVLIVGEDPASNIYVKNKHITAEKIGIYSKIERLAETITEEELLTLIDHYNKNPFFHGILVQLPLPKHINQEKILLAIDPIKDIDGFHPMNLGKLFIGKPVQLPCTPYGIIKLLEAYQIDLVGKQAVVVGRSNIVGKPMMHLLTMKHATVTLAHSYTENLAEITKKADILVAAIGKGHFITKEFVKKGAVVIDVGMNRTDTGKLIGDVKFDEVEPLVDYITPVPGGVGPMTITMLMKQTIDAAKNSEIR